MSYTFGIASRFYGLAKEDTQRLAIWVDAALALVPPEHVHLAIRTEEDQSGSLEFMRTTYPKVNAFSVTPWGRVVQAPNALLLQSAERGESHLLFTSTRYPVKKSLLALHESYLDDDTLVVGVRLEHDFKALPGECVLVEQASGTQIPWNTCALWSIDRLVHTGFVLTADSFDDPDNAGMEEMGTIAAQQILWPGKSVAKLVASQTEDLIPNTQGWTIERHERHMRILESKNARSEAQLKRLALPSPSVCHIGVV